MNVQKEKLPGFTQAPESPQKVCDENERNKEKNDARLKMLLEFKGRLWKSSMIDCKEPQRVDDC